MGPGVKSSMKEKVVKAFSVAAAVAALVFGSSSAFADAEKPVLRAGLTLEVSTLDPVRATNYGENIIVLNVYDMLVFPDPDKGVIPWIAKSWDVSDDRKTYTFHLRDDVLFHDGKPVEADDIAFSMRRVLTLPGLVGGYLRNVDKGNIEVVDPHTVRFHLKEVDPTFIRALVNLKILNSKLLMANKAEGQYGEFGDYGVKYLQNKDAGSGPYYIADFKAGEGITLKAFEGYKLRPWEPGAPMEVKLRIIPEVVTLENKMLAGEFDVSLVSPSPPRVKLFEQNPKLAVDKWPTLNNYYVVMNNKKPPLDDVNVRKAISYAFDADTVMNKIYSGGIRLKGPVPEALLGKCEGIPTYEYDMKKAAAWLAKSKYSADQLKKFKLEYASTAGAEAFEKVGLLLTLNLKKLGLNAEVKTVRWTDIVAAQTKPEIGLSLRVLLRFGARAPSRAAARLLHQEGLGRALSQRRHLLGESRGHGADGEGRDDAGRHARAVRALLRGAEEDRGRGARHLLAQRHPRAAALEIPQGGDARRRLLAVRVSLRDLPLRHQGSRLPRQPVEVRTQQHEVPAPRPQHAGGAAVRVAADVRAGARAAGRSGRRGAGRGGDQGAGREVPRPDGHGQAPAGPILRLSARPARRPFRRLPHGAARRRHHRVGAPARDARAGDLLADAWRSSSACRSASWPPPIATDRSTRRAGCGR